LDVSNSTEHLGGLSRPVLQVRTHHQVSPRGTQHSSNPTAFRPHPLLERLAMKLEGSRRVGGQQRRSPWATDHNSLNPTLDPRIHRGNTTRRLLDLLNGLHFRKLHLLRLHVEDLRWIVELVARCSDTLECLDAMCHPPGVCSDPAPEL